MKILVTGSSGFLGRIILKKLEKDNTILGLSKSGSFYNFDLAKEVPNFSHEFDLVIHSAGKAHFKPKNDTEINTFFDVNLKGTHNLLKGLENFKIPKRFVFISSVAVYGLEVGQNINEGYPLLAQDPYGLSKIKTEQLVMNWCEQNNVICSILRLPLVVGENPPGNLGSMIKGIKKGYYFNIAGGLARKSMVLAEDVSNIIINISKIGGVFNLTDGFHPSFHELSVVIGNKYGKSKILNLPYFIASILAVFGDFIGEKYPLNSNKLKKITSDLTFDDTKARNLIDWNPNKVLEFFKN